MHSIKRHLYILKRNTKNQIVSRLENSILGKAILSSIVNCIQLIEVI